MCRAWADRTPSALFQTIEAFHAFLPPFIAVAGHERGDARRSGCCGECAHNETFDADLLAGISLRAALDHGDTRRKSALPITAGVFNAATASSDPIRHGKTAVLYITEPDGSDGICLGGNTLTDGKVV